MPACRCAEKGGRQRDGRIRLGRPRGKTAGVGMLRRSYLRKATGLAFERGAAALGAGAGAGGAAGAASGAAGAGCIGAPCVPSQPLPP